MSTLRPIIDSTVPTIGSTVPTMADNSSCDAGEGKNGSIVSRYLDNLGDPRGERQPHGPLARHPLPMSMEEAKSRGWDELDVVFVTGDAYIDHPSFAMSILGRVLEAAGYRPKQAGG